MKTHPLLRQPVLWMFNVAYVYRNYRGLRAHYFADILSTLIVFAIPCKLAQSVLCAVTTVGIQCGNIALVLRAVNLPGF